ncbi:putative Inositol hexakisphosphate kinase 3, partial [Hypsibius exemplaris]
VYQAEVDGYKTWNKYFGRGLSVDGFKTALHDFLFNGRRFLHELIPDILTQLRQLSQVVRSLDGFRFYSSSLLIMYEGAPTCGPSEESEQVAPPATSISSSGAGLTVDVKMIDFAHSSLPTSNASAVRHRGPDTGYLFGLDNLIRLLEELLSSTVPLTV